MTTSEVIREITREALLDAEYCRWVDSVLEPSLPPVWSQQPEPTRGNLCDRCLRGTVTDPTTDGLCPECYADLVDADDDAPADAD